MRRILTILACVGLISSAQAQELAKAIFVPTPIGISLSIGKWIILGGERTYYIEVQGEGTTTEESRQNGFRIAVEQAVGSIVTSETTAVNNRLARDEIISYASGYVTRYEIISQQAGGIGVRTNMRVWIKKSNLANRLLNESSTPSDIEGTKASVQLATLQHERAQGDRLVKSVVNDFYRLGLNLETKPAVVTFDNNRNGVVTIPFTLKWNRNYLKSLWEAVNSTSQDMQSICWKANSTCSETASTISISTGGFFGGGRAGFTDTVKVNYILAVMVKSQPRVKMTLYNQQNAPVYSACYTWDELDHSSGFNVQGARYFVDQHFYGPPNVVIDSSVELNAHISLTMTPAQLRNAGRADLKLVPLNQCPK